MEIKRQVTSSITRIEISLGAIERIVFYDESNAPFYECPVTDEVKDLIKKLLSKEATIQVIEKQIAEK